MSVSVERVINIMESLAPPSLAESYDNVGLLVGKREARVGRILLGLDATEAVTDEALRLGAKLIITHHPVIFKPISRINSDNEQGRRLLRLIENGIAVFSSHTNLDAAEGGTNDALAELAGLLDVSLLIPSEDGASGLGRVGRLARPMPLRELAELLRVRLGLSSVRYCGEPEEIIETVGLCTGSAATGSFFRAALACGCDLYITADIKFHDAQDALNMGLCLIDATHYASEVIVLPALKRYLDERLCGEAEVFVSQTDGQVFKDSCGEE